MVAGKIKSTLPTLSIIWTYGRAQVLQSSRLDGMIFGLLIHSREMLAAWPKVRNSHSSIDIRNNSELPFAHSKTDRTLLS